MSRHSLYPGFIKLFYTGNAHNHVATIPVKPTASGATWKIEKVLGGTYDPWTLGIDALKVFWKAMLKTTDGLVSADLYTMASEEADPVFRETYGVVQAGTNAGAIANNLQICIALRTDLGGNMKIVVMEGAGYAPEIHDLPPLTATAYNDLANWAMSSAGCWWGRDGGKPIAVSSVTTKTNDALRKKYLLNA